MPVFLLFCTRNASYAVFRSLAPCPCVYMSEQKQKQATGTANMHTRFTTHSELPLPNSCMKTPFSPVIVLLSFPFRPLSLLHLSFQWGSVRVRLPLRLRPAIVLAVLSCMQCIHSKTVS